ncbi:helix-turn-helix domain-containing protein [Pseudomonas sp. Root569]|uniref:helix-turn-helix domain-containing protein n=1 Tax=Pseudomonas sp. Root569 TaxID=1736566 RepID=UPI0009EBD664|nr:AraC family transcriptional regulator [Pseudomonas sp. Root569]
MSGGFGSKYLDGGSNLLKSSADLGWTSVLTAEMYRHVTLECSDFLQPVTEVVVNIAGTAYFRRRAAGTEQRFVSHTGSASICPQGVAVRYLHLNSGPVDLLHIYMPPDLFGTLRQREESTMNPSFEYVGGLHDPLIQGIGFAVAEELARRDSQEATSRLMLDSLAVGLAARLLQRYRIDDRKNFTESYFDANSGRGLDRTRLKRVLEYIQHNLDRDISLDDLANAACLSVFHFSRSFKVATGASPIRYISDLRIKRAQSLLIDKDVSISEIAMQSGFTSAANLARSFRKTVGVSPSEYRLQRTCR